LEIKKTNKADLENKRWIGFVLGLVCALSVFFVAMEYSDENTSDSEQLIDLVKDLELNDTELLPAIDQQDLAAEMEDKKPTMEDMLNMKRSDTPQKVTPKEIGSMESNDDKTAAPNVSNVPVLTTEPTVLPDPPTVSEVDKEEKKKMTDESFDEELERYDDKVGKRILSDTPTPPGGWSSFMKWLTSTIKYPISAKNANKQGVVNVVFIVNADGSVSDIKTKNGKVPEFDSEVLRVVRTMGKWKPGIENNKPCRSMIEVPVVFSL